MKLEIIILAAGQGTRMRSRQPKVLHPIAGRPMLAHVIDTAHALQADRIHVVIGHGAEQVRETIDAAHAMEWPVQEQQLGTGHAVAQAMPGVDTDAMVLVLYGDVPLIRRDTLQDLLDRAAGEVGLLTVMLADPKGYGRILRNSRNELLAIVEERDASEAQRAICEVNSGILCAPAARLNEWLARLDNDNAQGEYYLTDIIAMAVADGVKATGVCAQDPIELSGINDRLQLARMERHYQQRQAEGLMREGLSLIDPARFDLRGDLKIGSDVVIDANVLIEGKVVLGERVYVGPNCCLRDVEIGDDCVIAAMSHLDGARIGQRCQIGPFARIRPGTELAAEARVGNFVEVKKSRIGTGSKINHLSYIGDTEMGAGVNIGAGTITCNYDGANKHKTVIGDKAFIGSDSQLVAPVTIGEGATIGAGSTITSDAPDHALTLSRNKQRSLENWKRPEKKG